MANNLKLKRSGVSGKIPTTLDLDLGELGLNTYDGKAYMKKNDGSESIVEIGSGGQAATPAPVAMSKSVINSGYTIPGGHDAVSFNETTVDNGITVTIGDGSSWEISGDISDYATAAQGAKADTAIQPSDLAVVQADIDQNESDSDAAIATEKARIDAILNAADADKDTFAEIVTLINSVDTTNDTAFAGYVLSNDAAVAAVQADVDQNEANLATVATSGSYNDLSNKPTLGTAATTDSSAYATAAQGITADSATQPGDLATVATSGDYGDLVNRPTIPTNNTHLTNGAGYYKSGDSIEVANGTFTGWIASTNTGGNVYINTGNGGLALQAYNSTANGAQPTINIGKDGSGMFVGQVEVLGGVKFSDGSIQTTAGGGGGGGSVGSLQQVLSTGNSSSLDAVINGITIGLGAGGISTNTAAGYQVLNVNTTGMENTGSGKRALFSNHTGSYNTVYGSQSLYNNTVGEQNTAVGYGCLVSNIDGNYNVAVGLNALYLNEEDYNTACGYMALKHNIDGVRNTATGAQAMHFNVSGSYNIASGFGALQSNLIGEQNAAFGYAALHNNKASYNTACGTSALYTNDSGHSNTASGYKALYANLNGIENVAVGRYALYANINGNANVSIGHDALSTIQYGEFNTAVGHNALKLSDSCSRNTAVGKDAQIGNVTGERNSSLGTFTLYNNDSGDNNVAMGAGALWANISGDNNVSLGYESGYYVKGSNNTILGPYKGTYVEGNTLSDTVIISAGTTERARCDSSGDWDFQGEVEAQGGFKFGDGTVQLTAATVNSGGTLLNLQQTLAQGSTSVLDAYINGVRFGKGNGGVTGNTAAGYQALDNATAGDNTAVGHWALKENLDGHSNTAVGTLALESNTSGQFNVSVGNESLRENLGGWKNVAIGYQALSQGDSVSRNVAIGYLAMYSHTDGFTNVGVGTGAMYHATNASKNTALGNTALYMMDDGENNTAVGFNAGFYLEGDNNTVLGAYFGTTADSTLSDTVIISAGTTERARCDSSGDWNFPGKVESQGGFKFSDGTIQVTAASVSSGGVLLNLQQTLTQGNTSTLDAVINGVTIGLGAGGISSNTAAGNLTLGDNIGGTNNTGIGELALSKNIYGNFNTAVGSRNMKRNTNGVYNTSVGHDTLSANIDGNRNTACGSLALAANSDGDENSALGEAALYSNNHGHKNTSSGVNSCMGNVTGSSNTVSGHSALAKNNSGNMNACLGYYSGYWIKGSSNTILGPYMGTEAEGNSLSNTVIISAGTTERARCDSSGNWNMIGTVTAQGSVLTSDQRFKENITPANSQLADVTELGSMLKNWDWTDDAPVIDKGSRFLGLVAQDVESICPGIVATIPRLLTGEELTPETTDDNGNVTEATYEVIDESYKGIKNDILIMKLLGAVAELSAKVEALENA